MLSWFLNNRVTLTEYESDFGSDQSVINGLERLKTTIEALLGYQLSRMLENSLQLNGKNIALNLQFTQELQSTSTKPVKQFAILHRDRSFAGIASQ